MNIREEHPIDYLYGMKGERKDIIQYYYIDKHIATLVKPTMILTINNDRQYKVKDKQDIANHIKKYYFKED